jgi:malate dehydrogenase
MRVAESGLADVVLLDIATDMARGKAFDLSDASAIVGHERRITGTGDYEEIRGSDIVVITAGLPRKPGMTREDLIAKNRRIVTEVASKAKRYLADSIVIVVTNPLDAMTYLVYKTAGLDRKKVFGMAGELDAARLIYLIAEELKVPRKDVKTFVLGSHGDTMVPIISRTSVAGRPLSDLMSKEKIEKIVERTRERGAEIVSLFGSGSAYYSPSAGVFRMVKAVLKDTKETAVVSAYLNGEYGVKGIFIGVPCRLGRGGIEEIVKLEMTSGEEEAFLKSAEAIKRSIES